MARWRSIAEALPLPELVAEIHELESAAARANLGEVERLQDFIGRLAVALRRPGRSPT